MLGGGVNMREAQIDIKKHYKTITFNWGGVCTSPRGEGCVCKNITAQIQGVG